MANAWRKVGERDANHVDLKDICAQLVCYSSIHEWIRDNSTNRETFQKVQVCENNPVRRIMGVKRPDKKRTDELRLE